MFCSVVIPTIGRNSLSRAVYSVLNQEFLSGESEIIIVNDSGDPGAIAKWRGVEQVRTITTNRRERCFARNTGAAMARGKYLWFLDDDDWVLPNAFEEFWSIVREAPNAVWLYGGIRIVDEQGIVLAERNSGLNGRCFAQIMGGAWAPIQASVISADAFFKAGGFNPHIIGTEDLDLCRKIAMIGELANTESAVACLYRGSLWATSTNYLRAAEDTRRSRDELLDEPGAYSLMHTSAGNAYWYGRIVRVYMSTINWNLQQGRFLKAVGRGLFTLASTLHAGGAVFAKEFWSGVRADHVPGSLHFVMRDLENSTIASP